MTRKEFEKVSLFVIFHFSIVGGIEKDLVHAVVQFYPGIAAADVFKKNTSMILQKRKLFANESSSHAGYFLISGIFPPIV